MFLSPSSWFLNVAMGNISPPMNNTYSKQKEKSLKINARNAVETIGPASDDVPISQPNPPGLAHRTTIGFFNALRTNKLQ